MKSGVHVSTISLIESGRRPYGAVAYEDIVRLARALNVDPESFFPVREWSAPEPTDPKVSTT